MKGKIILLAVALLVSATALAQNAGKAEKKASYLSLGPVAGFGHSWVSDKVNEFKPSAHMGLGMMYSRNEHWGLGDILTVSHEGYSQDVFVAGRTYTNTFNPVYLRMTPRVYYFFGDYKNTVRPKVFLGPSVAYKVAEEQNIQEPFSPSEAAYMRAPSGDLFRTWDFGANAGAGVNIKVAPYTWLNLDADYYHGLINVTSAENMNRSLRANLGVMIGI